MKYKNKSKRKKKKRGGNFNLSYQYGGNTGAFPNMNNLNIPGFNSSGNLDFSHVQGNLDAMNNAVLMGQVTAGMSGLADLQNNPGIQKMNLAQATVNPNRGFGAPPFQMGGSIDAYDKFDLAFAAARKSGKETFTYKGKSYNTKLKQKITSATSSSNSTKGTHSNGDSIDIKGEMPTKDRWANIPKNNFVIPPNGDIKPHVPSNHVPSNISDFDMLDIPQAMMMKAITGKYQKPGDLVRERGYGPFAQGLTNVVADPLNLIPYTKLKYLGNAVRKIGDQTALGNNLYSLVKGTLKADNAKDFIEPFRDTPKHQMGGYTPTKPKATSLEDKYNALRLKNATDVEETKEFLGDYEKYRKAENNKIDANLKKVEEMLRAADRAADMAKQGYSDNSPYGKEKSIVIPGNNIDMSNTSRPILGIPDIGETILMAPNSGSYNFPKATKVTEIPFGEKFQMGGGIGRDEEDRRYAQEVDSMKSFDANEDPFIFGSSFSEMGSDSNEMGNLYIEGMGLTRTEESKEDSNFLKKDKDFFNYKDYMLKTYGMGSFEDILKNMENSKKQVPAKQKPVKQRPVNQEDDKRKLEELAEKERLINMWMQDDLSNPKLNGWGQGEVSYIDYQSKQKSIREAAQQELYTVNKQRDEILRGEGWKWRAREHRYADMLKEGMLYSRRQANVQAARGKERLGLGPVYPNRKPPNLFEVPDPYGGQNKKYGGKVKKYQMGGEVMQNEMPEEVSIQTEVGEVVLMADGSIVDVKAKKKHSQMSDSTITDILPQGSYIASNDKSTFISKGLADSISLGFSKVAYDELDSMPGQPKELNFGSIFGNSSKLKPSDIARNIKKKYPLSDRKHDAFVTKTIEENKVSRIPYSLVLQQIAEKTKENKMLIQQQDTNGGVEKFQMGGFAGASKFINKLYGNDNMGYAKRDNAFKSRIDPFGVLNNKPIKFLDGGPIKFPDGGPIISAVGSIIGQIINYRAKKKAGKKADGITDAQVERWKEQYNINEADIQGAYDSARGNLKGSTAVNLMSTLAQDTYENKEDLSQLYTTANSMRDSLPQHIKDQQLRQSQVPLRGMTNSAFKYSGNSGNTMANLSDMYGKSLDSNSNLQAQQGANSLGLYNNKRGFLLDLQGRDAANLSNQINNIRGGDNLKTQTLGSQAVNYLNQDTALNMSELSANLQNRGTLNAGLNAADANRMSALGIDVSAAGNVAAGFSALGNLGSNIYNQYNPNSNSSNLNNSPYANPNYKFGQNQQPYKFGQNFNLNQNNSQPNMKSFSFNQPISSGLPNFQRNNQGQIMNMNSNSYIPYYQGYP